MEIKNKKRLANISRVLIGIVTFLNLQAAFYFMFDPGSYAPGFELIGVAGNSMVRGMGLLFLMWNVPYVIALIDPIKHSTSLIEAVIMQGIGVLGESLILLGIDIMHRQIHASVTRFIIFDAAGFVLLLTALSLVFRVKHQNPR